MKCKFFVATNRLSNIRLTKPFKIHASCSFPPHSPQQSNTTRNPPLLSHRNTSIHVSDLCERAFTTNTNTRKLNCNAFVRPRLDLCEAIAWKHGGEIFCPATRRNRYGEEGASRVDKFETMASFVAAKCSGSDNKRSEGA